LTVVNEGGIHDIDMVTDGDPRQLALMHSFP
jgi:hypothetical protein